jgi:hypothetical protein
MRQARNIRSMMAQKLEDRILEDVEFDDMVVCVPFRQRMIKLLRCVRDNHL